MFVLRLSATPVVSLTQRIQAVGFPFPALGHVPEQFQAQLTMADPTLPMANAPTIKIAEDLHPIHSEPSRSRAYARAETSSLAGGVFNARSISRGSFDRRSTSRVPNDRAGDAEEGEEWQPERGRVKQVFRGKTLLW